LKVIIVGGVAGGASCTALLRRLDEKAEILMVDYSLKIADRCHFCQLNT
jgi:hypothetical protein